MSNEPKPSPPNSEPASSDGETSLADLQEQIRGFCEAREWDPFHGAKDLAIGVITEAAELLEHFRFRSESEVEALFRSPSNRAQIESELADVMIFALRLAQKYEINLSDAIRTKLRRNEERYPVEASRGSNQKTRTGQR